MLSTSVFWKSAKSGGRASSDSDGRVKAVEGSGRSRGELRNRDFVYTS